MAVVWLDGGLVDERDAKISVLDRGLLNGYGLFETLRAYRGKPWALDDHYDRLVAGGDLIDLEVPSKADVAAAIDGVLSGNGLTEAGVRLTITGGEGPTDVQADPDSPTHVIVIAYPVRDYTALYKDGAALVTLAETGRPLAGIKTTSYAASVAGRVFARRAGADDAVFLGGHKRILEATGSNVFIASGMTLRTPSIEDSILPGVTRKHVIDVATREGFDVVEDTIYMDDVLAADEVVLTSSLREVYRARSIDGDALKSNGTAARLRVAYETLVAETI